MKPKIKKLKNGLRIITVPMKNNPTVTVMVMVEAGTRYETPETNGLSHFLEHMCFKGTQKRSSKEIAHELEAMGALTNAFTSYDYTVYYAKGRTQLFSRLLDVVGDAYLHSTFPEKEIEKERGVICGEIDMSEDMPQNKVQYMILEAIYGDQPAGMSILGPKENIKQFTRNDFLKYRDMHYVASKTTVLVAGNVESKTVEREVEKAMQDIPNKKVIHKRKIAKVTGKKVFTKTKQTDQSHLVLGMEGIPLGNNDETAFSVLTGVLGQGMSSRLFVKLREEMGAGYYASAENFSSDDTGVWEIVTGTEPKRVPEVITAIGQEIGRLKKDLVSEQELSKVKEFLIGKMYMSLESSNAVAEHVAQYVLFHRPIKMPQEIEQEIRKITVADIKRVANKYLKPARFHMALIGPHKDEAKIKKAFHFS